MDIKTQYRKNIDLFIWGIIACLWDFEITQTTTGQISFVALV